MPKVLTAMQYQDIKAVIYEIIIRHRMTIIRKTNESHFLASQLLSLSTVLLDIIDHIDPQYYQRNHDVVMDVVHALKEFKKNEGKNELSAIA